MLQQQEKRFQGIIDEIRDNYENTLWMVGERVYVAMPKQYDKDILMATIINYDYPVICYAEVPEFNINFVPEGLVFRDREKAKSVTERLFKKKLFYSEKESWDLVQYNLKHP